MASATKTRRPARRTTSPAEREAAEARREEKLAAAQAMLAEGIAKLTGSDEWAAMLAAAGKFHDYSFRNILLIITQMPDATQVAGFEAWKAFGRHVRKGEKGLMILAPIVRKVEDDEAADGFARRCVGFRATYVWDISQTDGDPIPERPLPVLVDGEAPEGMWGRLAKLVANEGFMLTREDPAAPGSFGVTIPAMRQIRVRADLPAAQAVKTLTHEVAHMLLKHGTEECRDPRSQGEVEAESVAFVVCQAMGLDTAGYSLPYVAGWAEEGREAEEVAATADRVVGTARRILAALGD